MYSCFIIISFIASTDDTGDKVFEDIFLDPAPSTPKGSADDDKDSDDGWSFTTYLLCFFFVTLGAILILFIVVLITIISTKRFRRRYGGVGGAKDTPILSDQDMLDAMKKTGYVNPTYKFYTTQSGE